MSDLLFPPEQLANEWATRICERLGSLNVPEAEIAETHNIIFAFTKTAVEELSRDRQISLPYADKPLDIDPARAHQIIELFLRGVNHTAKKLRDSGRDWDERKTILETMAWKLFNLAKMLVGFMHLPNPALNNVLSTPKDMQLMMRQSADTMLQEELTGQKGISFPFNFNLGMGR